LYATSISGRTRKILASWTCLQMQVNEFAIRTASMVASICCQGAVLRINGRKGKEVISHQVYVSTSGKLGGCVYKYIPGSATASRETTRLALLLTQRFLHHWFHFGMVPTWIALCPTLADPFGFLLMQGCSRPWCLMQGRPRPLLRRCCCWGRLRSTFE
jgi:hypothetical protein